MSRALLGRITIYSIVGCPHCTAAKNRLKEENLQYFDVSVDKFPDHVREWVREKTGKTSVPQIFFNSSYIGGNKELQEALDDVEKRKNILDILESEPGDDLPVLPSPGEALNVEGPELEFEMKTHPMFHLVEKMIEMNIPGHNTVPGPCRLWSSAVKNSVREKELLAFLTDQGEAQPEQTVETLLTASFLRRVAGESELYVLTGLESREQSQALNTFKLSSAVIPSPDLMSQHIRKLLLQLFSKFLSNDGSSVDYTGIKQSDLWQQFRLMSVELQRVDIGSMTEEEKLAFFINIYNVLVIHATVEKGAATNNYTRYKFFSGSSYNIGGHVWSLNDIENGILRSNRSSMATLYMKPFKQSDPRMRFILKEAEPRIHFALNCGAKSCPPIKTFSGDDIMSQLDLATAAFLENEDALSVAEDRSEIKLSQLFQWYQVDFGENSSEVVRWILDHVTEPTKKKDVEELLAKNQFKVFFIPYDWGHNEKED